MRHLILIVLLVLGSVTLGFAKGDPEQALKAINEYRANAVNTARSEGKSLDVPALNAKVLEMAKEAVAGVDPKTIDAKQGLAYAQLFQMAAMHREACICAERFIESGPTAQAKFSAQNIMLTSCNELGEGMMLMDLLKNISPPANGNLYSVASMTAYYYADTIKDSVSLDAALKTLKMVESNVRLSAPANEQEQRSMRSALSTLVSSRAEMLNDAGRKAEAVAAVDELIREFGATAPEARSLNGLKTRITLIGSAAPGIVAERSYGTFAGLDSLKGKVVIVDFFAHWCGPCIASFPDMKKLYADLKDKGLEIIAVTTYYGYYKKENTQKRDMPKNTEFEKMGEFIKDHGLPWPVVYGERSNFDAYGVTGIPHVAVIGRDGLLKKIKVGYSAKTFGEFRKEIEKLLQN